MKNLNTCLPKFPHRHQYTWPRVEAQIHPLQAECLNLEHAAISNQAGPSGEQKKQSFEICKKIVDCSRAYSRGSVADGEWKWLNENRRGIYLAALQASDPEALYQIFSQLFRQDASYGIVSGTYADFCDPTQRINLINGILCDVDTWLDYTGASPEEFLSMPDVGMPYGVQFGDNLVSPDICRHDYHAGKLFKLIDDMEFPMATILEIGGAMGALHISFSKEMQLKNIGGLL